MFYYDIQWFYQGFKSENMCFLNFYSVHAHRGNAEPVTRDHVKSSQIRSKTPLLL